MANTIVITKLSNGNIEVLKSGVNPRTHTSTYSCRSTATGIVQVVDEATRVVIDTFNPVDVEKVVSTDGGEVFISDVATLYTQLSTYFFFKPSANGGGSVPTPPPTGDGELISIEGVTQWDTRPYTVDTGTDTARFKGDGYFSGEVFTQQGSVNIGNVSHKSSNDRDFIVTDGEIYLKPRTKLDADIDNFSTGSGTSGTFETVVHNPFLKTDPQGQLQPVQDRTIDSTSDATTGYFVHPILATGIGNVWAANWYLRSSTGFNNYIVQGYKGHLDLGSITYELASDGFPKVVGHEPFFLSDLRSDFINGNAFSASADVVNDIKVPLNSNTGYWQNEGEELTFVSFASSNFQYEAGSLFGFDYPYVLADGYNWDEINTSSKVIFNGNESTNDFNGVLQVNNDATEYYGCDIVLDSGVYDKIEVPYRNRTSTADPAYLYGILLDQDNNTIAYKRLYVGQNAATDGTFIIQFDSDVILKKSTIYQLVIGRRGWNSNTKRVEIFHKDVNSSSGSVWVANKNNSNSALDTDDTSGVDWSTINKQNYNRVPKTLIYKY